MRILRRINASCLSLRLIEWLFLFCLLVVATSNAQTPKPTPQPAPRRPLPKLSNGARGFDFEKGAKGDSKRLIAVGGGWGAEEAPKPRLRSRTARGYYKLGDTLLADLEFEKAIPPLEQAVKMNPNYLAAYESLGYAYAYAGVSYEGPDEGYLLKRYRQAIGAFEQARRLAPKKDYLHLNLGVLYFNLEEYQKAVDSFNRGLQLSPKTEDYTIPIMEEASLTDTYEFIARAYEFMGQKELAVSAYQQALKVKLDENKADTYWMLGQLYEELDQPDLALASYLSSVSTTREWRRWVHDEEVFSRIGELYAAKQKYSEAADAFGRAISAYEIIWGRYPSAAGAEIALGTVLAELNYNLGVAQLNLKQIEKAVAAFQRALAFDPNYAAARFNLGIAYLSLNNKNAALEQARRLKDIDADLAKELEDLIRK